MLSQKAVRTSLTCAFALLRFTSWTSEEFNHFLFLVFVSYLDMETCCSCSRRERVLPIQRSWTQQCRTRLHLYHQSPTPPRPRPPHQHPPPPRSLAPSRRLKSRKTRSISSWPNRTERSTGTKTHSCNKHRNKDYDIGLNGSAIFVMLNVFSVAVVTIALLGNVCTVYH